MMGSDQPNPSCPVEPQSSHSALILKIPGFVAQQEARPRPGPASAVAGIVERAFPEREAAAADTAVEQLARALEHGDPLIERAADTPADALPVGARGRPLLRQGAQLAADLGQ